MELPAYLTVVKPIVLGGYAFGARHFVRLLRNPEHAKRGRMLTCIIFVAFGALMIWSALTATQRTIAARAVPGSVAFGASAVPVCNIVPVHRVCSLIVT